MTFTEISTDYEDDNGVRHIDGYTSKEEEGCVIGYVFNKQLYYTNPDFRYDSLVKEVVEELKVNGILSV